MACIMICSISIGFVTYHGYMECEINYNYNYMLYTLMPDRHYVARVTSKSQSLIFLQ